MTKGGGTIDRGSAKPLHEQLKEILRSAIEEGVWKEGDRLPTEYELCVQYNVSRTPVRQALQDLVNEGLLVRVPGRGTFVAPREQETPSRGYLTLRAVTEPGWTAVLRMAVHLWNQEHPHRPITLEVEEIGYPRLRSYLVEAVAAGAAPDVSLIDSAWVAEFADLGYILPLDEILPGWPDQVENRLLPAARSANAYNNRLMALPASVDVSVLWYRRDWLAVEGLKPPSSWDDIVAIGRHFLQPDVRVRYGPETHGMVFVAGPAGGETTTYQLLPLLWAAGGDLIAGGYVVVDSPGTRRFLTFLRDLIYRWHIAPPDVTVYTWDQAAREFAHRRAVMALGGLYEVGRMRRERGWSEAAFRARVGFAPIPKDESGPYATLGGMSYAVYRQSKAPEIALRLLEYTGHPEAVRLFWRTLERHTPWCDMTPSPRVSPFLAATAGLLAIGRPRPSIPQYARVSEQFRWLVSEALRPEAAIDELVRRAADRIAALTGLPVLQEARGGNR